MGENSMAPHACKGARAEQSVRTAYSPVVSINGVTADLLVEEKERL